MKNGIEYKDLIDLEYFLNQDQDVDDVMKHSRDRELFLKLQSDTGKTPLTSHFLIEAWVNNRVEQYYPSPRQKSPGSIFSDLSTFLNTLSFIKGIIIGTLTGLIFFSYKGTTPVNVFHFLIFFVFSQLALVLVLLSSLFLRKMLPNLTLPSFYSSLFRGILKNTVSFFQKQGSKRVDGSTKLHFDHAFSIIKVQSKTYGLLFYWPIFLLFQLFGIGFNLGLLGTTLFRIATSDLAFGWQSTIQLSSAAIHLMTKLLALPWLYLVPANIAHPSLGEIEGSRIILKEGIYHLSTLNLVAWWPFLVFCLIFYGLLLRSLFYGFGKIMEHYSFKKLSLDSANISSLLRRMQTPVVTTQAPPETGGNEQEQPSTITQNITKEATQATTLIPQLTLIPDEIFHLCNRETLEPYMIERGLIVDKMYRFQESYELDQQLLKNLQDENWLEQKELFIILEGWMVPLVDFISYLGQLRQLLPPSTIIHLGLVGRPENDALIAVKYEDFTLWKKKIATAADPYLEVFSLIPQESK